MLLILLVVILTSFFFLLLFFVQVGTLNYGRQPIGESDDIARTFTNRSNMVVNYNISNQNVGLTITPREGTLGPGESVRVMFTFRPMSEAIQCHPVIFRTDRTSPIKLQMYGGGGIARYVLVVYARVDADSYETSSVLLWFFFL